ncbi:MAG TPA: hypothetical protein VEF76_07645 [Patescibacteria group bacterium]|nr:hypothetical protein [Patescibacteria group bacterium]
MKKNLKYLIAAILGLLVVFIALRVYVSRHPAAFGCGDKYLCLKTGAEPVCVASKKECPDPSR